MDRSGGVDRGREHKRGFADVSFKILNFHLPCLLFTCFFSLLISRALTAMVYWGHLDLTSEMMEVKVGAETEGET